MFSFESKHLLEIMNKKKTNYLIAILNVIAILSIWILSFSTEYIENVIGNVTNNLLRFWLENIKVIMIILHSGLGILNIIAAIQNKDNKKICFWQCIFGICEVWATNGIISDEIDFLYRVDFLEWGTIILHVVIPIILAIKNFICIRKNKPKVIQVISYGMVIVVAILDLLHIFNVIDIFDDLFGENWKIISLIMMFIYIHNQEKQIEESKIRKIANIILYWILQGIITVGFCCMVVGSLLISKINEETMKKQRADIYNQIINLQGTNNTELYIPVEKDYKYGFITKNGEEKIACEYDRVSLFLEAKLNNQNYYFALAKQGEKYYIISKSNQKIDISENKYIKAISKDMDEGIKEVNKNSKVGRLGYIFGMSTTAILFSENEPKIKWQPMLDIPNDIEIDLQEENSMYYYKNSNYTLILEQMTEAEYYNEKTEPNNASYYNKDTGYGTVPEEYYREIDEEEEDSEKPKYKVTIRKNNGEETSTLEYIPYFDEDDATLNVFSDGYIRFESLDKKLQGWYDTNGNKVSIANDYYLEDIYNNYMILTKEYITEEKYNKEYYVFDITGKFILKANNLMRFEEVYLIKNENNKMVLYNKDLKPITKEYDKIICNDGIDLNKDFSSYE